MSTKKTEAPKTNVKKKRTIANLPAGTRRLSESTAHPPAAKPPDRRLEPRAAPRAAKKNNSPGRSKMLKGELIAAR
jgi:hypothetical protein